MATTTGTAPPPPVPPHPERWWSRRRWALAASVLFVAAGLVYAFAWGPVVHHSANWTVPGDIWGTYRSAQYVSWGDIGDVYRPETGLVSFPGITILLAPVALVADHFNLGVDIPFALPHPSTWLLLGPYDLLLGCSALVAFDGLAEHLGVARRARAPLALAQAVLLFEIVAVWGHPEDAVAVALAAVGLRQALRRQWAWAGWLFGAALATQPLVLLLLPLVVALAPVRRWLGLAVRFVLPSAALLVIPLVTEWPDTSRALFEQPNYPSVDHPTPWLALAPVLSPAHRVVTSRVARFGTLRHNRFEVVHQTTHVGEVVAAGPGRVLALVVAVGLGAWVWRRRPPADEVVWLAAAALAARCVFESVMDPYYLWPPLAFAAVAAWRAPVWRRVAVLTVALGDTVLAYWRAGPWAWWLPVTALLLLAVALARPSATPATSPTGRDEEPVGTPDPVVSQV